VAEAVSVGGGGFELVKMATVDVYWGAVGMAGMEEEKSWEVEDAVVVMLVEWKPEQKIAEGVAIGWLQSVDSWEELPRSKTVICFG